LECCLLPSWAGLRNPLQFNFSTIPDFLYQVQASTNLAV
jgi:hypothetical protein